MKSRNRGRYGVAGELTDRREVTFADGGLAGTACGYERSEVI